MSITIKDLTTEAPRSPRIRIGGYAILGRTLDKGRADLAGKIGEYHYDCPLDNVLFGFKGITGSEIHTLLEEGKSDEEIVSWVNTHGTPKTPEEIAEWSNGFESATFHNHPEKGEWFAGECSRLGIDPAASTITDMLEADDKQSFAK
jgi:hypothetical protein